MFLKVFLPFLGVFFEGRFLIYFFDYLEVL